MSDWTRCPDCGESIYIDDAYCGHCFNYVWGKPLAKEEKDERTKN